MKQKAKKVYEKLRVKQPLKTRVLVIGLTMIVLCGVVIVSMVVRSPDIVGKKHFVTFYDRGTKRSIVTRAATVKDALSIAHIAVDSHDIVEPSLTTKLTDQYEDVIIYRSRLVAIVDGGARQSVMTVAQSPNQILEAARLTPLAEKDKATIEQGDFIVDGAATKLRVERAEPEKEVPTPAPVVFCAGPK